MNGNVSVALPGVLDRQTSTDTEQDCSQKRRPLPLLHFSVFNPVQRHMGSILAILELGNRVAGRDNKSEADSTVRQRKVR